jgi:hypothetical protein
MVYNPATDFLGLWRLSGGDVSKMEMPGLDYMLAAFARAGIINLSVSATEPVVNQSITAWLQPAVPSWTAEGGFFLWDAVTSAYLAATPELFLRFLQATAGQNGVSWWTAAGGPPLNTVGNDGDFAIRTDTPYGIYGPKAAGAWPANAIPGTEDTVTSDALDNAFGNTPGAIIRRGPTDWEALAAGANGELLAMTAGLPAWSDVSALLDAVFGDDQGSLLFRGAGAWGLLAPGFATEVLESGGPGADPAWAPRTAEFASGTRMPFQQSAAPTGWTTDVSLNDYGLRVVSGAAGVVAGTPFSTVFAQTDTGGHALTVAELAPHTHSETVPGDPVALQGGGTYPSGNIGADPANTGSTGSGDAHTHPINLTLAYVDVIIASKD